MLTSSQLGQEGEKQALSFLRKAGYKILLSNLRNKSGELDIIAKKKSFLCIIEVKTRRSNYSPLEAVTPSKQRKICKATKLFQLQYKLHDLPVRFDILGISGSPESFTFELVEDAFVEEND